MKNKSLGIFLLLLCAVSLSSCKKNSPDPGNTGGGNTGGVNPPTVNVYACGYQYAAIGGTAIAEYWKNGAVTKLTDGSNSAFAVAMAVSGGDVYIAGEETVNNKSVAKYWKNRAAVNLTDGKHAAVVYGITVAGADVYVCGFEQDDNGVQVPKYWKNGVAVALPHSSATTSAIAYGIAVSGADVYVAGTVLGTASTIALYWKNGVENDLSSGADKSYANGIKIDGSGNIFVCGYAFEGSYNKAQYWKNGVITKLGDANNPTFISYSNNILLNGNDVIVGGYAQISATANRNSATYWKNGAATPLSDGTTNAAVNAVAVNGNDMYAAGYVTEAAANAVVATFWKNGALVDMASGAGSKYGTITGVVVQ